MWNTYTLEYNTRSSTNKIEGANKAMERYVMNRLHLFLINGYFSSTHVRPQLRLCELLIT